MSLRFRDALDTAGVLTRAAVQRRLNSEDMTSTDTEIPPPPPPPPPTTEPAMPSLAKVEPHPPTVSDESRSVFRDDYRAPFRDEVRQQSCAPKPRRSVPDSYAPTVFDGKTLDPEPWIAHFQRYTEYRQMEDDEKLAMFPLFLRGTAVDWYDALDDKTKQRFDTLLDEFKKYFCKTTLDYVFDEETVFTRVQRPGERARDYVAAIQKLAKRAPHMDDNMLIWAILRGLRPNIRAFVLQQKGADSVSDIIETAKIAETVGLTDSGAGGADMTQLMNEVRASRAEVQQLSTRMNQMSVNAVAPPPRRSPTPERRGDRRVRFDNTPPREATSAANYRRGAAPFGRGMAMRGSTTQYNRGTGPPGCDRCGRVHPPNRCIATGLACHNCGKIGHLRARCRSARRGARNPQ